MGDFGYVVLIIFIIIRILIAAGLFYLIVVEIRRYKGRRKSQDTRLKMQETQDTEVLSLEKEISEGADGKDVDSSSGGRD
jgi:predicted membrane protein